MIPFLISILPVFLFLAFLLFLDSYKLINKKILFYCISAGIIVALLSWFISLYTPNYYSTNLLGIFIYISPLIEEFLKSIFIFFLIKKNKSGFIIDSAIYGFAIGTGFALTENIYYLFAIESTNSALWIIRGFGTAIMHGGTTAIFAISFYSLTQNKTLNFRKFAQALIPALILHYCYNFFLFSPIISTAFTVITVPIALYLLFENNIKSIRNWMDEELDMEITIIMQISKGKFADTRSGKYIISIKNNFDKEIVLDMINYITIYLELSIKAKSVLLLKETGHKIIIEESINEKFVELEYLKKSIGKTALLALRPILKTKMKDLWQLQMLKSNN